MFSVHLWMAHEISSEERKFVFSDTCLACHKCFWSSARLQQHVRLSRKYPDGCYAQHTWRYAPLSAACVAHVPEDLRGYKRVPSVPVATPGASPLESQVVSHDDALRWLALVWRQEGLPDALPPSELDFVVQAADALLRSWRPVSEDAVDRMLFDLGELVAESSTYLWALFSWSQDYVSFRRFPHLPLGIFQRFKQALDDMLAATPIGRLLAWQNRMSSAFLPPTIEASNGSFLKRT